jgi:cell division septum initiation protein DivIVA
MEMQNLKEENKELKDRVDELVAEVSELRQQALSSRRTRNTRQGSTESLMSEYVPSPLRGTPVDGLSSPSAKIKRTLPPSPDAIEKQRKCSYLKCKYQKRID